MNPVRSISAALAGAALVMGAAAFVPHASSAPIPARGAAARDTAVFAGGCFWSMEKAFEHVPGVVSAVSGYAGGSVANPSYEQVGSGRTGHAESVQVVFDPARTSYDKLLDVYWHNIDPISANGQICDHGPEYRSIVFFRNAGQRRAAEASKAVVQRHFTRPVTTEIDAATPFYAAEEYHQDFAERNPDHYNAYRRGCGRDARLHELWGDAAGGSH
ncbi:peptide-methionine (S)-S-oxide reductase MsrA [Longimicrobium sp.]|uniref:peptide-methionine (S)-S-oxide reductase MsrA n=1 Tax=Longimicrobium sp. TaxID=2029185 RepID=UPI002CBB5736|nr:peptide-methionine (S)-S-oxide reductase MsrA [Longimicrobium sp.]HSU15659.1 peptide-methionine (S)-S-oxide reductase MsrA [Longimicrobium sp.]